MLGTGASLWLVAMLSVVLAPAAQAHFGWSAYDASRTVTLDGIVEAIDASNSDTEILLRVGNALWTVLLAPPAVIDGITRRIAAIGIGDRLIAVGFVRRDTDARLRAVRFTHGGTTVTLA